ncbi:hypothetical protein HPB50_023047 [Hyalomma asiaticum]|uniref:Uncharacterized protein n=1 Tax=Hyalomma asiaticum TaxID=266040 RepID=A0ACB7TPZ4_HYAAI|nr:hypothetical protein HPB50_023047 [Hyalomma asiaticum]
MDKMLVKFATQIFSSSMAAGMKYYQEQGKSNLSDCEGTIEFTLRLNDLYDALNRRYPAEGIKQGSSDIRVLKEGLKWLNEWEKELSDGLITKDMFLARTTAEGLRVTLNSTIDLCNHLLNKCSFRYVLTAKFNQDPLECFFGKVRQAAGENDHPDMPTFMQVYRTLSIYTLLKPPKFGNCEATEDAPILDFACFKSIFKCGENSSERQLEELRAKLDGLVDTESYPSWQAGYAAGVPIFSCVTQSSSRALLHLVTSLLRFLQLAVPGNLCGGLAPASSPVTTTSQLGLPCNMGSRSPRLFVPLKLWPAAQAWSLRPPFPAVSYFGRPLPRTFPAAYFSCPMNFKQAGSTNCAARPPFAP